MTNPAAAGQDYGPSSDPDITGDVQRSGSLTTLMSHGDIGPVKIVTSSQEKDILPHHQVIVDGDNPIERFEVLADTYFVPDDEVLPAAEVSPSLNIQFPALMSLILPEHMPANCPADPHGQFAQDRRRGFGKETGEPVIKQFAKCHIG